MEIYEKEDNKKNKLNNNKYYEKNTEFRRKLLEFFDNINIYKDELDSLLTCNFQIFETT